MIQVSEWFMIACPSSAAKGEEGLNYDRAVPGGGSAATADEVKVGPDPSATDAIVVSLRPGTTAKPLFFYRPINHPDWARTEGIPFSLATDANAFDDASLPSVESTSDRDVADCARYGGPPLATSGAPTASPVASSSAVVDAGSPAPAVEIADIDGQPPLPADDAWAGEKEVLGTGSDALGCKTKLHDSWFFAQCSGKVAFTSVDVERGKHKTQTHAEIVKGELRILTPYVQGTDFRVHIVTDSGERFLILSWLKTKHPFEVARFVDTRP